MKRPGRNGSANWIRPTRNAPEMYGSFDGILGGTLPVIALLDSSNASPDQVDGHANNGTPANNGVELAKSA